MNPQSRFRMLYQNDTKFYKTVISKEEPPFEFKIHLFLDDSRNEEGLSVRDITTKMMQKLDSFEAKNVKDYKIYSRPDHNGETRNDKIRFTFCIDEKEKAIECF